MVLCAAVVDARAGRRVEVRARALLSAVLVAPPLLPAALRACRSCDDTAVALVSRWPCGTVQVHGHVVCSQFSVHATYKGALLRLRGVAREPLMCLVVVLQASYRCWRPGNTRATFPSRWNRSFHQRAWRRGVLTVR